MINILKKINRIKELNIKYGDKLNITLEPVRDNSLTDFNRISRGKKIMDWLNKKN